MRGPTKGLAFIPNFLAKSFRGLHYSMLMRVICCTKTPTNHKAVVNGRAEGALAPPLPPTILLEGSEKGTEEET